MESVVSDVSPLGRIGAGTGALLFPFGDGSWPVMLRLNVSTRDLLSLLTPPPGLNALGPEISTPLFLSLRPPSSSVNESVMQPKNGKHPAHAVRHRDLQGAACVRGVIERLGSMMLCLQAISTRNESKLIRTSTAKPKLLNEGTTALPSRGGDDRRFDE
jgi:hypothetical protein